MDFCPTPEQIEAHLDAYGFDYKPTVACSRDGEVGTPKPPYADDPDESLSTAEVVERVKQELLNARAAPNPDGDPTTIEYVTADGRRVEIETFGDPRADDMTPAEFAKMFP